MFIAQIASSIWLLAADLEVPCEGHCYKVLVVRFCAAFFNLDNAIPKR